MPKAVRYPIDIFTILFIFENDNKAVGKWFFARFTAVESFIQNEHVRFGVKRVFFVGFNNVVLHGFGLKWMCFATLRTQKFFKRKKEKKEIRLLKWRVSKNQVFKKKYYPIRSTEREVSSYWQKLLWNSLGGDFF